MSTHRISHSFLEDAKYIHNIARGVETGVASENGAVRLENPATSGKDVLVLEVRASGEATGVIVAGITATTIGTAPAVSSAKTNRGATYAGTTDILGDTDTTVTTYLAAADILWRIEEVAGVRAPMPLWNPGQYIVLPPGFGLTIVQTTDEIDLDATFVFADVE